MAARGAPLSTRGTFAVGSLLFSFLFDFFLYFTCLYPGESMIRHLFHFFMEGDASVSYSAGFLFNYISRIMFYLFHHFVATATL